MTAFKVQKKTKKSWKRRKFFDMKNYLTPHTKSLSCFSLKGDPLLVQTNGQNPESKWSDFFFFAINQSRLKSFRIKSKTKNNNFESKKFFYCYQNYQKLSFKRKKKLQIKIYLKVTLVLRLWGSGVRKLANHFLSFELLKFFGFFLSLKLSLQIFLVKKIDQKREEKIVGNLQIWMPHPPLSPPRSK